ncbi:cation:proton antiporter [Candidatus Woesearchaeota archaeon]|nr:cation:proton antiporter [Candidatus Woesearchaeota archaeon]
MAWDTLTVIALALAVSFVMSEAFFSIKYPRVIGQILTGIILGLPFIKVIFNQESLIDIKFLADLGIIFLLLLTGMKINLEKFRKSGKDTIYIALFGVLVPFFTGFILMRAMGYDSLVALIFGAAISLTAEGTKLKVLMEMNMLNTKVGMVMLGAGILDDIFEVLFLAGVLVIAEHSYAALTLIPIKIVVFVIIVVLTYKLFPYVLGFVKREHSRIATLSLIILFGLVVAVASHKMGLGNIIGAFIAGVIINIVDRRTVTLERDINDLESITFAFIIPFFFINIGLHFDIHSVLNNVWLTVLVLIVATISKIAGALVAKPFTKLSLRQAHLIGWGLNSRGAIELIIAEVALQQNLIPIEIYSSLVFMAIVTTLLFPFMVKSIVKTNPKILNE